MCCDDKKDGMTKMQGGYGQPVGLEADPRDFMNPGSGFGEGDVLGAIFARMGMGGEGQEEMGEPSDVGEQEPDLKRQRAMMGGY